MLDVADRANPRLITYRNWSPPFGGGTHNCLPLPDRDLLVVLDEAVLDHQADGLKLIWVFDNRVRENPVSISTCPTPVEADYKAKGAHFGPHNIHARRDGHRKRTCCDRFGRSGTCIRRQSIAAGECFGAQLGFVGGLGV